MVLCAAVGCNNDSRRTSGISYYKFQSRARAVDIQKKWLINIRRKNYVVTPHSSICSDHFEEGCFVRDLQAELLNIKRPRKIKDDALPTVFNHDTKSLPTKRRLHTEKTTSDCKTKKIDASKSGNKYMYRKLKKGSLPTLNLVTGTTKLKKSKNDKTFNQCVVRDEMDSDLEIHNKIHLHVKKEKTDDVEKLHKMHVKREEIDNSVKFKEEKIDMDKRHMIHVEEEKTEVDQLNKIHVKEENIVNLNFFQCNLCDRKFNLYTDLEEHCKIHVEQEKESSKIGQNIKDGESIAGTLLYQCTVCQICFKQYLELEEHCKTHVVDETSNASRSHHCKVCGISFRRHIDLEAHFKLHVKKSESTESTARQCTVCKKDITQFTDIAVHLRTCGNICPDGRKEFVIHLLTEAGNKSISSEVYGKVFDQKCAMKVHMETHTEEKPYKCDVCDKSFKSKGCQTRHMHIHMDEKPFMCIVCNKLFNQKSNLEGHMSVHTREKQFIAAL